jgi:hypothetical protein
MAAVSWLMHGVHSDEPKCACPIIRAFVIPANDAMDHATRQRFIPFLHRIAGSRSPEHEAARMRVLVLAAVRVFAPLALDAAGVADHAARLRALPDDVTYQDVARAADAAAYAAARAVDAAAHAAAYAADAAARAVDAAHAAAHAAHAAYADQSWDAYFAALDAVLRAGPEGEEWSATQCETAQRAYAEACV